MENFSIGSIVCIFDDLKCLPTINIFVNENDEKFKILLFSMIAYCLFE